MPKQRKWTDKQLQEAVAHSFSYRQTILRLGLVPAGGNFAHVKRRVVDLGFDTGHFKGKVGTLVYEALANLARV